jgi:hypothetical protein
MSDTITQTNSKSSSQNQKPSAPSQRKTKVPTEGISHTQGQKKESRNAKRKRWAKANRPKQAPKTSVRSVPVKEYVSSCCSVAARKPRAGQKEMSKDPETGKMANQAKGLGKWRCSQCSKRCSVTVRKPETTLVTNIPAPPEGAVARYIGGMPNELP